MYIGVRVEPEEVLEEHRVAAHGRVEETDLEDPLDDQHQQGDAEHRGREHLDQRGGVEGPEQQRHPEPGHAGRPELVDRHHEVEAGEDRTEAEDEDTGHHRDHAAGGGGRRVRRVEGPAGVEAAVGERNHREDRTDDPEVEAAEVQPRERHVLRTEHDRQHEVAEVVEVDAEAEDTAAALDQMLSVATLDGLRVQLQERRALLGLDAVDAAHQRQVRVVALVTLAVPVMVPQVPRAAIKCVIFPSVCFQISGPVVL